VDKIKLDILGLSSSQSDVGHFALVLGETNGNRRLPIIIDGYQARAIALEMEKIKPNRPMTHDLIVTIAKTFGIELKEVLITDLKDGIFYARLVFEFENDSYEIDSRTSDAVAVGVRFDVPIYTTEAVLAQAGIEVKDTESEDAEEFFEDEDEAENYEGGDEPEDTEKDKLEQLRSEMNNAISDEDYERRRAVPGLIRQCRRSACPRC
jgi:bifunctional DNase/RNase